MLFSLQTVNFVWYDCNVSISRTVYFNRLSRFCNKTVYFTMYRMSKIEDTLLVREIFSAFRSLTYMAVFEPFNLSQKARSPTSRSLLVGGLIFVPVNPRIHFKLVWTSLTVFYTLTSTFLPLERPVWPPLSLNTVHFGLDPFSGSTVKYTAPKLKIYGILT